MKLRKINIAFLCFCLVVALLIVYLIVLGQQRAREKDAALATTADFGQVASSRLFLALEVGKAAVSDNPTIPLQALSSAGEARRQWHDETVAELLKFMPDLPTTPDVAANWANTLESIARQIVEFYLIQHPEQNAAEAMAQWKIDPDMINVEVCTEREETRGGYALGRTFGGLKYRDGEWQVGLEFSIKDDFGLKNPIDEEANKPAQIRFVIGVALIQEKGEMKLFSADFPMMEEKVRRMIEHWNHIIMREGDDSSGKEKK
ncbi:MAG: hypothetical protein GX900_03800 [Clostridiaceae bacterium]|nr:hypothetical protein [Clostridiaceae bacterium]